MQWYALGPRLDIAYAVSVISRFLSCPNKTYWGAIKLIMRYLKGFSTCCLLHDKSKGDTNKDMRYVDSDFARDLDKRKFISRCMFMLNMCIITLKASLQSMVGIILN